MRVRHQNLFITVILFIIFGLTETLTHAEIKEAKPQLEAMETILGEPYEGTPENYLAFAADQGKRIAAIADELLANPNLTEEEITRTLERKYLAIEMASDEENSLSHLREFLDANQERPEIKGLYQKWIDDKYNKDKTDIDNLPKSERIASFRECVTPLLPLLLRYDNTLNHYEPVYKIMNDANRLDPDSKEGLVAWLYSELHPIFDKNLNELQKKQSQKLIDDKINGKNDQENYDLLANFVGSNTHEGIKSQNVLGMLFRPKFVGQPMEYEWISITNEPISTQNYLGKILLIFFINDYQTRELTDSCLRKVYAELHPRGLEIITHGCITHPANFSAKIPCEDFPWTEAPESFAESHNVPLSMDSDYPRFYGLSKCNGFFLIDRDGKVVLTRSDAYMPSVFDCLKTFFPDKEAFLDECSQEFNTTSERLTQEEKTRHNFETSVQKEFILAQQLYQRYHQICDIRIFASQYNDNTPEILKLELTIIDQYLASPNFLLHPELHHLMCGKYNRLLNLAILKAEEAGNKSQTQKEVENEILPETPPEIFFTEVRQYVDETIERTDIPNEIKESALYVAHDAGSQHQFDMMCYYLKQMETDQEEYAAKFLDLYIKTKRDLLKIAILPERKNEVLRNFYFGLGSIAQIFYEVDKKYGTRLEETLREIAVSHIIDGSEEKDNTEK